MSKKISKKEILIRDRQMREFRYNSAKNIGVILSFCGNIFTFLAFIVIMHSFFIGLYAGEDAGKSMALAFSKLREISHFLLPTMLYVSVPLAVLVKILSHDPISKFERVSAEKSQSRSLFCLMVFMTTASTIYLFT